jgi:inhibitor of KinA sporulation pathway (predicted exonuclease)
MSNVDLMLDLETLATGHDACVVQIGACYFDRVTGEIFETFEANVLPTLGHIDGNTVMWWLQQSEQARASLLKKPSQAPIEAFTNFRKFASRANNIWSHATFDFVIVQDKLRVLDLPLLNYKFARDIRTLTNLVKLQERQTRGNNLTHHSALDDCKFQVQYCTQLLNKIRV